MAPKYIFVTGGVVSSLGKGLAAASIGALLEARGFRVTLQKMDPYINVDAGTMSPYQHGEVFVTDDGGETDLDLGHYERFTSSRVTRDHNVTTGKVYYSVIQKERRGDYLGRTVQVIPHITDEIKASIRKVSRDTDVVIVEVGGTVGDIEGLPFLEAARQFRFDVGKQNAVFIHLTWVPFLKTAGEVKTKPSQHSVAALRQIGIQPDILLCRAENYLADNIRAKLALFCNVEVEDVFTAKDVEHIYDVPLMFHQQGVDDKIVNLLNIWTGQPRLGEWEEMVTRMKNPRHEVTIAVVGKYVNLVDSYKSLNEALAHGGIANDARVKLIFTDSEKIEKEGVGDKFKDVDGILVPGGFGLRGIEGMIRAAQYARENKVPYLGICLGMQIMVIEYCRSRLGLKDANSTEFAPEGKHPVVSLLEEQVDIKAFGGTMRLGRSDTHLKRGSRIFQTYGSEVISERHRHRYEVSNRYRQELEEAGLIVSGVTPDAALVESVEWPDHPWGLGVQFHPEFKSKPLAPSPLFSGFITACLAAQEKTAAART